MADHFRRQKPAVGLEVAETLSHPAPLPDEAVEQHLQMEAVIQKMRVLSADRAEVLALHSFGGLKAPQVAKAMNKSEAAVRMLIFTYISN